MERKVIICLCAPESKGKTSSIRKVYEQISEQLPENKKKLGEEDGDFYAIIKQEECTIGFSSLGDPKSKQKEWLEKLLEQECEIIVTASRTEQFEIVESLSEKYEYTIKRISPVYDYENNDNRYLEIFHQGNADVIKSLIDKIKKGEL